MSKGLLQSRPEKNLCRKFLFLQQDLPSWVMGHPNLTCHTIQGYRRCCCCCCCCCCRLRECVSPRLRAATRWKRRRRFSLSLFLLRRRRERGERMAEGSRKMGISNWLESQKRRGRERDSFLFSPPLQLCAFSHTYTFFCKRVRRCQTERCDFDGVVSLTPYRVTGDSKTLSLSPSQIWTKTSATNTVVTTVDVQLWKDVHHVKSYNNNIPVAIIAWLSLEQYRKCQVLRGLDWHHNQPKIACTTRHTYQVALLPSWKLLLLPPPVVKGDYFFPGKWRAGIYCYPFFLFSTSSR